jgi:hypothetical protein
MDKASRTHSPYDFSSRYRETSGRDRLRHRRATAICGVPIRGYGDDNIGADAKRVIEVKVASRCVLHGDIAVGCAHTHALHVRRRAARDRFLQGTRVKPFDGHGRACVQVSVVHGIFGYHRRDYEELARARDFLFWQCIPDVVIVKG